MNIHKVIKHVRSRVHRKRYHCRGVKLNRTYTCLVLRRGESVNEKGVFHCDTSDVHWAYTSCRVTSASECRKSPLWAEKTVLAVRDQYIYIIYERHVTTTLECRDCGIYTYFLHQRNVIVNAAITYTCLYGTSSNRVSHTVAVERTKGLQFSVLNATRI